MNTLALKYYLKARDNYPYELSEVIENLNYALSYDDEQPEIYCLLAVLYYEQLKNVDKATYYYELALAQDMTYQETYYQYAHMLIENEHYEKAKRLLKHLESLGCYNKSSVLQLKALISEKKKNYDKAISRIKQALKLSTDNEHIRFLKNELERIQEKQKNN